MTTLTSSLAKATGGRRPKRRTKLEPFTVVSIVGVGLFVVLPAPSRSG